MPRSRASAVPQGPTEQQVQRILSRLNLLEKISLLSGKNSWQTRDIPHANLPSVTVSDGPHGVVRTLEPCTMFPSGISMGATWDSSLIEEVGKVLGEETAAKGYDVLLGPCVNIVRHPLAGRNFETFSEDPYLSGQIGVAYVKGVQSRGVGTSLKHFACNNQEYERGRGSSNLDQRTLREIYLPAFEAIVKKGNPWTIMCAYNRINGIFASEHHFLLTEVLREEWGYSGLVMSDWGATHSTASVEAGLDLEMPGPGKHFGVLLADAVYHWQVRQDAVDEAARRVIRLALRVDHHRALRKKHASLNTRAHAKLAQKVAESAITLLKNEGAALPLQAQSLRSLAVIGPNADTIVQGGGSSRVPYSSNTTPLQALRKALPKKARLHYAPGCENRLGYLPIPREQLTLKSGREKGITIEFFDNDNFEGTPVVSRVAGSINFNTWWFNPPAPGISPERYSVRWSGFVTFPDRLPKILEMDCIGYGRLFIDNRLILESTGEAPDFKSTVAAELQSSGKRKYAIRAEFVVRPASGPIRFRIGYGVSHAKSSDEMIAEAVEAARHSDAALLFVGSAESYETETFDRPHMDLVGMQNRLISEVAAVNPRTVVVLNCGAPVTMPWIDSVPSVVQAYFPGMEGGTALANILLGKVCPSGKLPETYPKRIEDSPAFPNVPGDRYVTYGEELLVGYRYFDTRRVEPLFPFGHGLSYTTFKYSDLKAPRSFRDSQEVRVELTVQNTGTVAGAEVVQLYVSDTISRLQRPQKELKGFKKVFLSPGEKAAVTFTLNSRSFSYWDQSCTSWIAEPGEFTIAVGSSSRDIRLRRTTTLRRR